MSGRSSTNFSPTGSADYKGPSPVPLCNFDHFGKTLLNAGTYREKEPFSHFADPIPAFCVGSKSIFVMTEDNVLVALIGVSVGPGSRERRAAAAILLRVMQARRQGAAPLSSIMEIIGAETGAEVAREIRVLIGEFKLR